MPGDDENLQLASTPVAVCSPCSAREQHHPEQAEHRGRDDHRRRAAGRAPLGAEHEHQRHEDRGLDREREVAHPGRPIETGNDFVQPQMNCSAAAIRTSRAAVGRVLAVVGAEGDLHQPRHQQPEHRHGDDHHRRRAEDVAAQHRVHRRVAARLEVARLLGQQDEPRRRAERGEARRRRLRVAEVRGLVDRRDRRQQRRAERRARRGERRADRRRDHELPHVAAVARRASPTRTCGKRRKAPSPTIEIAAVMKTCARISPITAPSSAERACRSPMPTRRAPVETREEPAAHVVAAAQDDRAARHRLGRLHHGQQRARSASARARRRRPRPPARTAPAARSRSRPARRPRS